MKIGVTGGRGFVGWHVRSRLWVQGHDGIVADRATFADPNLLDEFVGQCDVIVHAAGVNRGATGDVYSGNVDAAEALVDAMRRIDRPVPVAYINSVQSDSPGQYGESKRASAAVLRAHQEQAAAPFLDVIVPHVFGEYGRPHYNSVVATFASELATGGAPDVNRSGQLELIHAQDVAQRCLDFAEDSRGGTARLPGRECSVGAAWDLLRTQHERYVDDFTIPAFESRFELQMFNMLRSHLYSNSFYPRPLTQHADERGAFMETSRSDGPGQTSISTTAPGVTRGDHFHLDKVERFVVIDGVAEISLRRVLTDDVSTFEVSGGAPAFVDMPPLTTHNITNVGSTELITMFWAADHFDPQAPDTYAEPVDGVTVVATGVRR